MVLNISHLRRALIIKARGIPRIEKEEKNITIDHSILKDRILFFRCKLMLNFD